MKKSSSCVELGDEIVLSGALSTGGDLILRRSLADRLQVKGHLTLTGQAEFTGEIQAGSLTMVDGAKGEFEIWVGESKP
jgi:hypothetical protein